jgi:hypothetical protein
MALKGESNIGIDLFAVEQHILRFAALEFASAFLKRNHAFNLGNECFFFWRGMSRAAEEGQRNGGW